MEIAAEVWFWVGPKATGTARFGREPRRHGACIKGSYPTNPSGTCRSADGPVAVIALANRKGDAVRRSVLASGASEVGTADCIRHVYPAWRWAADSAARLPRPSSGDLAPRETSRPRPAHRHLSESDRRSQPGVRSWSRRPTPRRSSSRETSPTGSRSCGAGARTRGARCFRCRPVCTDSRSASMAATGAPRPAPVRSRASSADRSPRWSSSSLRLVSPRAQ